MLGLSERAWSTRDHRADRQFAAWQQMTSDAFVPVTLTQPRPTPVFAGECRLRSVGRMGVGWLASGPQIVHRTPEHIADHPGRTYFVNFPLSGHTVTRQDARRATTQAGDFVVVDADRPFTIEYADRFEQISLSVPHDVLDPLLASPRAATCVTVPGRYGVGALASAAVRALARQQGPLDSRQAAGVVAHVVGLICLAISGAAAPKPGSREALLQAALDEIDLSLADAGLTLGTTARRINISPRYLTDLFADRGTTFGRYLLGRRLDRAWAALTPDASARPATITEVALACGFRDSSHFSRTFRARFGVTPTQRRTGHPAGDPRRPL